MIRKFGYDDIYRFAGEGDEKKVLVGIRRKKERAKKKRAGGDGEEGGEEVCRSSFLSYHFPFISFDSLVYILFFDCCACGFVESKNSDEANASIGQEDIKWKRIR